MSNGKRYLLSFTAFLNSASNYVFSFNAHEDFKKSSSYRMKFNPWNRYEALIQRDLITGNKVAIVSGILFSNETATIPDAEVELTSGFKKVSLTRQLSLISQSLLSKTFKDTGSGSHRLTESATFLESREEDRGLFLPSTYLEVHNGDGNFKHLTEASSFLGARDEGEAGEKAEIINRTEDINILLLNSPNSFKESSKFSQDIVPSQNRALGIGDVGISSVGTAASVSSDDLYDYSGANISTEDEEAVMMSQSVSTVPDEYEINIIDLSGGMGTSDDAEVRGEFTTSELMKGYEAIEERLSDVSRLMDITFGKEVANQIRASLINPVVTFNTSIGADGSNDVYFHNHSLNQFSSFEAQDSDISKKVASKLADEDLIHFHGGDEAISYSGHFSDCGAIEEGSTNNSVDTYHEKSEGDAEIVYKSEVQYKEISSNHLQDEVTITEEESSTIYFGGYGVRFEEDIVSSDLLHGEAKAPKKSMQVRGVSNFFADSQGYIYGGNSPVHNLHENSYMYAQSFENTLTDVVSLEKGDGDDVYRETEISNFDTSSTYASDESHTERLIHGRTDQDYEDIFILDSDESNVTIIAEGAMEGRIDTPIQNSTTDAQITSPSEGNALDIVQDSEKLITPTGDIFIRTYVKNLSEQGYSYRRLSPEEFENIDIDLAKISFSNDALLDGIIEYTDQDIAFDVSEIDYNLPNLYANTCSSSYSLEYEIKADDITSKEASIYEPETLNRQGIVTEFFLDRSEEISSSGKAEYVHLDVYCSSTTQDLHEDVEILEIESSAIDRSVFDADIHSFENYIAHEKVEDIHDHRQELSSKIRRKINVSTESDDYSSLRRNKKITITGDVESLSSTNPETIRFVVDEEGSLSSNGSIEIVEDDSSSKSIKDIKFTDVFDNVSRIKARNVSVGTVEENESELQSKNTTVRVEAEGVSNLSKQNNVRIEGDSQGSGELPEDHPAKDPEESEKTWLIMGKQNPGWSNWNPRKTR